MSIPKVGDRFIRPSQTYYSPAYAETRNSKPIVVEVSSVDLDNALVTLLWHGKNKLSQVTPFSIYRIWTTRGYLVPIKRSKLLILRRPYEV